MKLLTAAEMAEADARSVAAGIPIATLMENAGSAVARFCLRHYAGRGPVVVLCGKGNNGGDGLVAARQIAAAGRPVRVALLGKRAEMQGAAAEALRAFEALTSGEVREITAEPPLQDALAGAELIIDAVVGTGFKPPLRGLAATVQALLQELRTPVVAVDLPSGWDADSMAQDAGNAFRADAVVTFAAPKLAHIFGNMTTHGSLGAVVVADIGTPADAVQSVTGLTWAGASKRIAEAPRAVDGNKGRYGHVLVIGGSRGKSGAPAMASLAALRTGAGLVTAAVPASVLPMVATVTPELMCMPLEERDGIAVAVNAAAPALERLLKGIKVVALGPGLGTEGEAAGFARALVERVTLPMVIDADALNALAGHAELLRSASAQKDVDGKHRSIVLTPHPGEMARLLGQTVKDVEADRIGVAREFATAHGVTLVLKGWRTLIAHPDGSIAVNTTGNAAMAKGGSGDILTGIVAAMVAQFPEQTAQAVEAAVFLHGLAADFALLQQDEHTMLATDTVAHLWEAFRARTVDRDGLAWITAIARSGARG